MRNEKIVNTGLFSNGSFYSGSGLALDAKPRRRARDEDPEDPGRSVSAETCRKFLSYLSGCGVRPEILADIREMLAPYCNGSIGEDDDPDLIDAGLSPEEREMAERGQPVRESAEDRRRRGIGADGRFSATVAFDARRHLTPAERRQRAWTADRRMAADVADREDFAKRYPGAARIQVL